MNKKKVQEKTEQWTETEQKIQLCCKTEQLQRKKVRMLTQCRLWWPFPFLGLMKMFCFKERERERERTEEGWPLFIVTFQERFWDILLSS